jgi:hypothetical protein
MQCFWRNGRLQIEPSNQKERDALLVLTQSGDLRNFCPDQLASRSALPLEIEVAGPQAFTNCQYCTKTILHNHWIAKVTAMPEIECSGISAKDAYDGAVIQALLSIAQRLERSWGIPNEIATWFQLSDATLLKDIAL